MKKRSLTDEKETKDKEESTKGRWRMSAYVRPNDRSPFLQFRKELSKNERTTLDAAIEHLMAEYPDVKMPLSEMVQGVAMIRCRNGKVRIRTFYAPRRCDLILLFLNGFRKKADEVTQEELDRARKLKSESGL